MIKKVQKLSDLPILYNLLVNGSTIVALKESKSNYKININQLKGKKIVGIEELGLSDNQINQIKVNFDTGEYQYLNFYNGSKGETGEVGDKGPDGDKGESFNRELVLNRADDVLVIVNDSVTNDPNAAWSAFQGKLLEDFLKSLSEVFMTDEEYQLRFNEQVFIDLEFKTKSADQNSVVIYNDNVKHKTYVKYWTYESETDERYYYYNEESGEYIEVNSSFDIWKDFYLSNDDNEYYTRRLVTTITNQDTGEGISEWVYDKMSKPIWMDLEFESYTEDRKSILIYSDEELGDDGVVDKDPKEEEIVITHRPITSITVNNPSFTLPIHEIITKEINILPVDYINSPICIEYDEDMITVFEDGRIMALETPGETVVKIYSADNPNIEATISINIVIPVLNILFNINTIKAFKGNTYKIDAIVEPENATNPSLDWYSSDPEIASVDKTGKVTLIKEGNVTIYAATKDGTNIINRIDVSVDTAINNINIHNTNKAIFAKVGTTINITDINELFGEEMIIDESIITISNEKVSYNTRTKNIKFDTLGLANMTIETGENIETINLIIDNSYNEVVTKDISQEILVGHTSTITADILPENASNMKLNWNPVASSSAITINTDTNGKDAKVYLSEKGNYDIHVVPQDGSLDENNQPVETYITLIGKTPVKTIELDKYVLSLDLGETYQLTASVNDDADDKKLVWSSNNPNAVSVDQNGFVRSILGGDAIITATANDGSGVFARCNVSSVVLITDINITNSENIDIDDIDIYIGNEYVLKAKILPENAYNKQLIWYTSNDEIATVNNGILHAIKEGTVKVYAMADDNSGVIASINANVSVPINELLLADIDLTLQVNENYTLIASVIPDDATTQKLQYTSLDPTIASIDIDGNITALKTGTTEIFVSTIDGTNLSQKCTINIID